MCKTLLQGNFITQILGWVYAAGGGVCAECAVVVLLWEMGPRIQPPLDPGLLLLHLDLPRTPVVRGHQESRESFD